MNPLLTEANVKMYTPRSFFGALRNTVLNSIQPARVATAKKTQVSTRTCIVENAMLESNSLEVIDERIMQGVVTSRSKSTKYLVAEAGNMPFLYRKKPTAMIKNIEITLDIIVNMRLFYHFLKENASMSW